MRKKKGKEIKFDVSLFVLKRIEKLAKERGVSVNSLCSFFLHKGCKSPIRKKYAS